MPLRTLSLALLAGLLATPCAAQEALFLRIRPHEAPPPGGIETDPSADEVAAARAAREAVWERSDRRARLAIASVCTDCLPPAAPKAHSSGRDQAARLSDTPSGTGKGPEAPPIRAAFLTPPAAAPPAASLADSR